MNEVTNVSLSGKRKRKRNGNKSLDNSIEDSKKSKKRKRNERVSALHEKDEFVDALNLQETDNFVEALDLQFSYMTENVLQRNGQSFNNASGNVVSVVQGSKQDDEITSSSRVSDLGHNLDEIIDRAELSQQISDSIIKRLAELEITLLFEVPSSHGIETRLSHPPTIEQREKFTKLQFEMKQGRFNPDEDRTLIKNWNTFSKEYLFDDPTPFLTLEVNKRAYIKKKERIKFVQYLGQGLPRRYLRAIYVRFQLLLKPRGRAGRFTADEDAVILEYMSLRRPDPFATLSRMLLRNSYVIYIHYKSLTKDKKTYVTESGVITGKVKWNYELVQKIVESLVKVTGISHIEQCKNKVIPWQIWHKVSKEVNIPPISLKNFWNRQLSTQIFATKPIYYKSFIVKLLKRLKKLKVNYWQDMDWNKVSTYFDGVSPMFLWCKLRTLMVKKIPEEKKVTIGGCVEYLLENIDELLRNRSDFCLQRIKFNEFLEIAFVNDILPNEYDDAKRSGKSKHSRQ